MAETTVPSISLLSYELRLLKSIHHMLTVAQKSWDIRGEKGEHRHCRKRREAPGKFTVVVFGRSLGSK